MVLVKELVTEFERFAPKELAMPKDPVGLQLGFLEQEVTKMMVTLDVRPETVAEAIANGCVPLLFFLTLIFVIFTFTPPLDFFIKLFQFCKLFAIIEIEYY